MVSGATMKALRKLHSKSTELAISELPIRELGPDEVLVSVFAAGICGTDLHIIDGSYPSSTPVTLGHEIAGLVEAVGFTVDSSWIGKRVAVEPPVGCETCRWCLAGIPMHCPNRMSLGTHIDGGLAERVIVPARNLHELPTVISDHAGALLEPLACVCNALLDPISIKPGDRVVVIGPGTIGILAAQVAGTLGGNVTLVGLRSDEARLDLAKRLGIDTCLFDEDESRKRIEQQSADEGTDMVIECSGSEGAVPWAFSLLQPRGHLVLLGLLSSDTTVKVPAILTREFRLSGSYGSTPKSWDRAVELVTSCEIQLDPLVTSVFPLEDWRTAFEQMQAQQGVKTLLDPRL